MDIKATSPPGNAGKLVQKVTPPTTGKKEPLATVREEAAGKDTKQPERKYGEENVAKFPQKDEEPELKTNVKTALKTESTVAENISGAFVGSAASHYECKEATPAKKTPSSAKGRSDGVVLRDTKGDSMDKTSTVYALSAKVTAPSHSGAVELDRGKKKSVQEHGLQGERPVEHKSKVVQEIAITSLVTNRSNDREMCADPAVGQRAKLSEAATPGSKPDTGKATTESVAKDSTMGTVVSPATSKSRKAAEPLAPVKNPGIGESFHSNDTNRTKIQLVVQNLLYDKQELSFFRLPLFLSFLFVILNMQVLRSNDWKNGRECKSQIWQRCGSMPLRRLGQLRYKTLRWRLKLVSPV